MENNSEYGSTVKAGIRKRSLFNPAIPGLIADVGLNFFRYLRSVGMSDGNNVVVLSSRDNYTCNKSELKNVRIVINLKKLNLIKHLDLFLKSLVRILPPNTSFIGYFSDVKTLRPKKSYMCSILRLLFSLINLSQPRTTHVMSRNEVRELLEKNGFKTLNMREMNGFTYFVSQNVGAPV